MEENVSLKKENEKTLKKLKVDLKKSLKAKEKEISRRERTINLAEARLKAEFNALDKLKNMNVGTYIKHNRGEPYDVRDKRARAVSAIRARNKNSKRKATKKR